MPLYLIERDFAAFNQDEFEAAALRSKMCVPWVEGLEWVRSFHDVEGARTLCIYRANSEPDVRTHAHLSGIPCGQIWLVDEITPEMVGAPVEELKIEPLPAAEIAGD